MSGSVHMSTVQPHYIRTDLADCILRLTLDYPSRRNALGEGMMATLQGALDAAATDASVKVVVIAATGPAFCAGHDLKEMSQRRADPDHGRAYFETVFARCAKLMTSEIMMTNMLARDAEEGIDAFIARRTPVWEGR